MTQQGRNVQECVKIDKTLFVHLLVISVFVFENSFICVMFNDALINSETASRLEVLKIKRKTAVTMPGVPTKIQTEHFQNTRTNLMHHSTCIVASIK
jgi:hypothetical protein